MLYWQLAYIITMHLKHKPCFWNCCVVYIHDPGREENGGFAHDIEPTVVLIAQKSSKDVEGLELRFEWIGLLGLRFRAE